jgi:hypothetical protein
MSGQCRTTFHQNDEFGSSGLQAVLLPNKMLNFFHLYFRDIPGELELPACGDVVF